MRTQVFEVDSDNFNSYRNTSTQYIPGYEEYIAETYFNEADLPTRPEPKKYPDCYTTSSPLYEERHLGPVLGNTELPVHEYRREIVQAVSKHKYTIISAETGAGKSTQVAQMLLSAGYNVIQTHPRRIAAREICERQRDELSKVYGPVWAKRMVSYQTALEQNGPQDAPIRNVTDGLELARELGEKQTPKETVVIVDEVHESNCNIEFLMAWAKMQGQTNDKIRFVFMSATMDSARLANYYAEDGKPTPPILEIPGRTYPVEHLERPESTVVDETIKAALEIQASQISEDEPNGILVFAPGVGEISEIIHQVKRKLPKSLQKSATILPLYADLSPAEQKKALARHPGVTIVVATNVAETSLTIPGMKYVIDSGMERREELDSNGLQGLVLAPISKSQCGQRAGRAGRIAEGIYILTRLHKKSQFIGYADEERPEYPVPEILRTDIGRNILRFADAGYNMLDLDLFNQVKARSIKRAQKYMRKLGALDKQGQITEMGRAMNKFPTAIEGARLLHDSQKHSETVQLAAAAVAAINEVGGLIDYSPRAKKGWQKLTEETSSDLLAQLDLYITAQDMNPGQLAKYGFSVKANLEARQQFARICKALKVQPENLQKLNDEQRQIVRKLLIVAQSNNIYAHSGSGKYRHVSRAGDSEREISSRSRLAKRRPEMVVGLPYRVEYERKDGKIGDSRVVERVTATTPQELGRVAVHLTHWKSEGFLLRDGYMVERRRQFIGKFDLGVVEEFIPKPSPRLRRAILDHVVEQPLVNQRRLLRLKKEVEALARKSKAVRPFTQDHYLELLERAAPKSIADRWTIDNNLGQILIDEGITIDAFAPRELRKAIADNSPDRWYIEGDLVLDLEYSKGQPYAKHYNLEALLSSDVAQVTLPDGREIQFIYQNENGDTKSCNLFRLRRIFDAELVYS